MSDNDEMDELGQEPTVTIAFSKPGELFIHVDEEGDYPERVGRNPKRKKKPVSRRYPVSPAKSQNPEPIPEPEVDLVWDFVVWCAPFSDECRSEFDGFW